VSRQVDVLHCGNPEHEAGGSMSCWSRICSWASAMIRRSDMEREMDAELQFHMEAYAMDLVRNGVSGEEALRLARLEFGGVERTKEECRDARGVSLIQTFLGPEIWGTNFAQISRLHDYCCADSGSRGRSQYRDFQFG